MHDAGPRLIVIEGGAPGGSSGAASRRDALLEWVRERFPRTVPTHVWAAQDYHSVSELPLVGPLPGTERRIIAATGYGKWGLTNGVAAALAISADILGGHLPWARELYGAGVSGGDVGKAASFNLMVAQRLTSGWARALVAQRGRPVAQCRVDGKEHRVSGICTHLGGVLQWNDAESTWDCPLHGSRFAADGTRLEGPATRDLREA
jgi:nitrite reductase/ring-hydroxylating ferredoxin subunit